MSEVPPQDPSDTESSRGEPSREDEVMEGGASLTGEKMPNDGDAVRPDLPGSSLLNDNEIRQLFSQEDIDEALDNTDIDALLSAVVEGGGQSMEDPLFPEGEISIEQQDIEALLDSAEPVRAPEPEWIPRPEPVQEASEAESMEGAEIGESVPDEQREPVEETVGQDTVDSILADAQPAQMNDAIGQSEIDALLAGEPPEEAPEAIDESRIDEILGSLASGGEAETIPGAIDQSEIDALLSMEGIDEDAHEADAAGEDAGAKAAKPAAKSGEPASKETKHEMHPAQAVLDALVLAGLAGDEEPADTLEEVPAPPKPAVGEKAAKPYADEAIPELVSSENIAASVPASDSEIISQDLLDNLVEEAASAGKEEVVVPSLDELAEELGEAVPPAMPERDVTKLEPAEKPKKKKRGPRKPFLSIDFLDGLKRNAARLAVSALVGLAFASATHWFLQRHRDLTPLQPGIGETIRTYDIQEQVEAARGLVKEGRYGEALNALDRLLAEAPSSADMTEAEFLRIESAYKSLPSEVTLFDTESVQFSIDRFADKAPAYPRLPEALLWKADMYERNDMLYEARRVYERIITTFANVPNLDEVLFAAAKLNLELKRYSEAGDQLSRILNEFPGSGIAGEARMLLADTFAAGGKREAARQIYQQIADTQPGTRLGAEAYTRLGKMAIEEGRYEEGIRLLESRLETALTIEGNDQVYLALARAYADAGRPEEAERVLRELIDFFPESGVTPDALVELSKLLAQHGKRSDALQLALQAVQRFPNNKAAARQYADLLIAEGRKPAAAEALLALYDSGEADPDLLLTAGRLLRESLELDAAKEALNRVVSEFGSSPQAFDAKIELAKAYRDDDDVEEAAQILEGLLLNTEDVAQRLPVLTALGDLYAGVGAKTRTAQIYAEIARSSDEPALLKTAALALFDAEAWEEGLAVANRVNPAELPGADAYTFLHRYGKALLRADANRGLEKMEQAYESYPAERRADADLDLLEAYLTVGRYARARVMVTDIEAHVRNRPVDAIRLERAALAWGDDLYARGDYRGAAEAYDKALTAITGGAGENADWARFQRANALFKLNDFENSVLLYDEVAGSASPWAQDAVLAAENVRLEQRTRGLPVTQPKAAG